MLLHRTQQVLNDLLGPAEFGLTAPLEVTVLEVPGEPIAAEQARAGTYEPIAVGDRWGRRWGTAWFRLQGEVPADWAGEEVVAAISLGPGGTTGFGVEGLVWDEDTPLQGLSPNHTWFRVREFGGAAALSTVSLHVEAAANPPLDGSLLMPDFEGEVFGTLQRAELAVRHADVAAAVHDVEVLRGLLQHGREDDPRTLDVHRALTAFCALLDPDDVRGSLPAAREALAPALARPANASAHRVVGAGHAHIDTAWLWPVRETVRKCARSFATAVSLMEEYPDYRFVVSQALHHDWMKDRYPALFERMRKKVADGQLEPVGSMWVEADCNIPSGESLVRQIVLGKRFFLQEYGVETRDVWLPDVFGYSAALPQLMKLAGIDWFLTQKISWSQTNKFPHHTFWWEGIDGTRIFSHFPPADTYNGDASVGNLLHSSRNFKDHDKANVSLYPYGWGDGGGGPTREHLERLARSSDLEGLPKVELGGVSSFFTQAVEEAADDLPVWAGELYLEFHRGTYTTHGSVKKGNRQGELALREAELWSSYLGDFAAWPAEELDRLWKILLVNQFHDIIPGSSIHWVYEVTREEYADLLASAGTLVQDALAGIAARVDTEGAAAPHLVLNPLTHSRHEVVAVGGALHQVEVPGLGHAVVDAAVPSAPPAEAVTASTTGIENAHLRVTWDAEGLLTSVYDKDADREVLAPGARGNVLQLHHDRPMRFDAWDVDRYYLDTVRDVTELSSVEVVTAEPLRGEVRFTREFGDSKVEQVLRLDAGSRRVDFATKVDWRERHKFLKVAFPVDVRSAKASFEVQFGHVERPTHVNTSWDWARFEVVAQKWADLSEPDYGVALLNDCKHGYDVRDNVLRLSLLRSSTLPDPEADQGEHEFTYALYPHQGDLRVGDVVSQAHALGAPLRVVAAPAGDAALPSAGSLVAVDRPGVVVEAVKRSFDRDTLIVRLYESFGQRQRTTLACGLPLAGARVVDLLERELDKLDVTDGALHLELKPFQVITLELDILPATSSQEAS